LFVSLPSSALLIALGEPSVAVLFGRGAFGETAIVETGRSLMAQAAGIWAVASIRTVVPLFHAMNDTRTPVVASALNLVVFGGAAFALFPSLGHVGLAISITAASVVQLTGLLLLLRHRAGPLGFRALVRPVASMLVAALASGVAMALVASLGRWREGGNVPLN